MALTLKKRFSKRFFGYHLTIFLTIFLKSLIGFIALLTLSKVKFKSFTRILSIRLCFFKKCIKGVKAFLKECERLLRLQGA